MPLPRSPGAAPPQLGQQPLAAEAGRWVLHQLDRRHGCCPNFPTIATPTTDLAATATTPVGAARLAPPCPALSRPGRCHLTLPLPPAPTDGPPPPGRQLLAREPCTVPGCKACRAGDPAKCEVCKGDKTYLVFSSGACECMPGHEGGGRGGCKRCGKNSVSPGGPMGSARCEGCPAGRVANNERSECAGERARRRGGIGACPPLSGLRPAGCCLGPCLEGVAGSPFRHKVKALPTSSRRRRALAAGGPPSPQLHQSSLPRARRPRRLVPLGRRPGQSPLEPKREEAVPQDRGQPAGQVEQNRTE